MPARSDTSLPGLPTELILQILEYALACTVSYQTAAAISLVSSWTRKLAIQYVFTTIIRRSGVAATDFRTISREGYSSRLLPPAGVGHYVRHLWLQSVDMNMSSGELATLNACPNIEQLATSSTAIRTLYAFPVTTRSRIDPLKPTLWSLTLLDVTYAYSWHWLSTSSMRTTRTLLENITHLRLVTMSQGGYIPVEHFPNLTHLAIPLIQTRDIWHTAQAAISCRTLEIIVFAVSESDWLFRPWMFRGVVAPGAADSNSPRDNFRRMVDSIRARDQRLYVTLSPRHGRDLGTEWADAVRGGENIWDRAIRVVHDNCDVDSLPTLYPRPTLQYG